MTGTSYGGDVTLPNGISFTTTIYVPEDAAYPDQGELAEVAQMGVSAMSNSALRGASWKKCRAVYANDGNGLRCELDRGHEDHHRGEGVAWSNTIDPWAGGTPAADNEIPSF